MKPNELRRILVWLLKRLTVTEFLGVENIPLTGGVLIATNHMSRMDIPVLFLTPNRPDMTALVTTKYLKYPLIRWFIVTAQGIWLDRDSADFGAFRTAVTALNQGMAIGIAPEGTRSKDAQLLEGKPGAALLALRAGVPILPVALSGTEDAVTKMKQFKRPHITAQFGKLIPAPELDRNNREEQLQQLTDEIMCQIGAMLPEHYRGFYKDHPRLKEILAENSN
ncbi:MAG: 1-acyl-sn-glycerol-3-phosphate acyltransferase [Chloroflexi bacterium HGW-Chloroflexi-4]|jgi:1-acyl-sn-glycerol-3-phosphate acyltransferase|nr:MAG: 1-acyl-sn-glycerol-3-phosphate acyltransferase [Chloroflexi bacterium HGW-Chloroflexi-4]